MLNTSTIDFETFHALTLDFLYLCLALMTFVFIERLIYLGLASLRAARLTRDWADSTAASGQSGPIAHALDAYVDFQRRADASRSKADDMSSAMVIDFDGRMSARLWILETIVTAAPLLGLLGTILGIMQTFSALAQGGVSDPAAVSRGIGSALLATAVGIATALLGLAGYSLLSRQAEHLSDRFKVLLLRATVI